MMTEQKQVIPEGYKQNEIGIVIPNDWVSLRIDQTAEVKRGAASTVIKYSNQSQGVRFIRINDFFENNPVYIQKTDDLQKYAISAEDILFAGTGNTAGASYIPLPEWTGLPHSYNAPRIRVKEDYSLKFVFYSLQSSYLFRQQKAQFVGAAQPFLDTKAISSFVLVAPATKQEQTAIANALSDVDALITELEKLIAKKQAIKTATMQQLLTGKTRLPEFALREDGTPKGYKQSELGEIPEDWEVKTVYDLADNQKAQFDDGDWIEAEHITDKGIRLIQTGNIGVGLFVDKNAKKYIYETSFEKLKCKALIKGDVLICRLAEPAGRACILPDIGEDKVITSVDVTIFRPSDNSVSREFYVQYFSSNEWFKNVLEQVGGTTHKRISRGALGKINVPLPSINEQNVIASILSCMDSDLQNIQKRLDKTRQIKQGMMQELLTGKTRLVKPEVTV